MVDGCFGLHGSSGWLVQVFLTMSLSVWWLLQVGQFSWLVDISS